MDGHYFRTRATDIHGVLPLGDATALDLLEDGVAGCDTLTDQLVEQEIGLGPIATPCTERESGELLPDVLIELTKSGFLWRAIPDDTTDVSRTSRIDETLTVRRERLTCDDHTFLERIRVTIVIIGDGKTCVQIVWLDLVTGEVPDRFVTIAVDGHLDDLSDLIDRTTLTDKLHDGVPSITSGIDECGEPVGTNLYGTCSVTYETVDMRTTIDLDDISDLEGQLITNGRGVMCSDIVDTDVAGECELASILPDDKPPFLSLYRNGLCAYQY